MTIVITHGIVETLAAGAIIVCVLWFMVMVATDDWSSDRPEPKMSHASRKLPEHGIPPPERFLPSEMHATKPAPIKAPPPPRRSPRTIADGTAHGHEVAAMGYPVGPTPEMPLRAPERRFYAPASLTLPDWVCGPVTAKLYRLQLDRAAQIRELVSGIPPYREPTVDDLSVMHKTGLPPSVALKLSTIRK